MTALAAPTTAITTTATTPRLLLQVDAASAAALGVPLAVAAPAVSDLLGTSSVTAVRWVGVALVVYAADLLLAARSRWARPALLVSGIGSIGWEVASLAVAAFGGLSTVGTAVVVAQGLAVGAFGLLQLRVARAHR